MELSQAPAFVAVKLAMLSDACATAAMRADELTRQIAHIRDRLNGVIVREGDDPKKLRQECDRLLAEEKALALKRPIEAHVLGQCRAWLAGLLSTTVLEQIIADVEDGVSLSTVRTRIEKLKNTVERLKDVPVPPSNIREKVQTYVQGLTRPVVGGIASDEALAVRWPNGLHELLAFVEPDVLAERLLAEIGRIANTPCPLAEREQWIAEAEAEIDRLQRTEEAIVIATGAPRERGCLPWIVLGVKAVKARDIRAA